MENPLGATAWLIHVLTTDLYWYQSYFDTSTGSLRAPKFGATAVFNHSAAWFPPGITAGNHHQNSWILRDPSSDSSPTKADIGPRQRCWPDEWNSADQRWRSFKNQGFTPRVIAMYILMGYILKVDDKPEGRMGPGLSSFFSDEAFSICSG